MARRSSPKQMVIYPTQTAGGCQHKGGKRGDPTLFASMDLRTSWARAAAAGATACPAANWIAARVVISHKEDETDAQAERAQCTGERAAGKTTPRRVRPRRSLSRARANRLWIVPAGQRSRRAA